jgi:hypothetical protein
MKKSQNVQIETQIFVVEQWKMEHIPREHTSFNSFMIFWLHCIVKLYSVSCVQYWFVGWRLTTSMHSNARIFHGTVFCYVKLDCVWLSERFCSPLNMKYQLNKNPHRHEGKETVRTGDKCNSSLIWSEGNCC